ncbi:hypothetical protein SAMN05444354_11518 [Stigmatella aurantiaca]|uniref:Uncharacterized protein n=1 Tax=Stigmatella aurantiaca TaxID=41 RepID=A0A1H7XHJ6_STIAU|nr:hypothetical protein [Stigmatella aurantiaca]SEM33133.1 hypothetical protein SAMN05444354_11518 [Stigmatella aurantiaca]
MTTKAEMRQRILREFKAKHGPGTVTAQAVAEWAVKNGLEEKPVPVDPMTKLAEEYAKAFREEHRRDPKTGRTYRANHAVTVSKDGKQYTLWGDIDEQPRAFMEKAFKQRREQVVGDLFQLTLDCDHYNAHHPEEEPIQIPLDFSDDVAERKYVPPEEVSPGTPTHDA